jgi:hypothetical protein
MDTKYFLMKIGKANAMLDYRAHLGGLWFGNPGGAEKSYIDQLVPKESEHQIRIVVFEKRHLRFFRATQILRHKKRKEFSKEADPAFAVLAAMYPNDQDITTKGNVVVVEESDPVFDRFRLTPFVDSLSVYQGLNRGTCRAFAAINSDKDEMLADFPGLKDEQFPGETLFGAVVRLYFDALRKQEPGWAFFKGLTDKTRERLVLATLNPAQMETAAMLIFLDLGMTPLVGVAKGLDVVDVRMSLSHLSGDEHQNKMHGVIDFLKRVGVEREDIIGNLQNSGILDIQCKAYNSTGDEDFPGVLRMAPLDRGGKKELLALWKLGEDVGPLFRNWLQATKMTLIIK